MHKKKYTLPSFSTIFFTFFHHNMAIPTPPPMWSGKNLIKWGGQGLRQGRAKLSSTSMISLVQILPSIVTIKLSQIFNVIFTFIFFVEGFFFTLLGFTHLS